MISQTQGFSGVFFLLIILSNGMSPQPSQAPNPGNQETAQESPISCSPCANINRDTEQRAGPTLSHSLSVE